LPFALDVGYGASLDSTGVDTAVQVDASSDASALPTRATQTVVPAGRYASLQRLSTLMTLPPTGSAVETVNTSISLHEVTHVSDKVHVVSTTCGMWQPEITGVQTVFSQSFVDAIPSWSSTIHVGTSDGGDVLFELVTQTIIFGAELADPENSPLPTEADAPQVRDPDGDGNPGVTVKLVGIINGQMYVVQRRSSGMAGSVNPTSGRAEGQLLGEVQQQLIGASEPELMQLDLAPVKHPDPNRSTFIWLPIDATETCQSLMNQGEGRFEAQGSEPAP